jgi:hypothetical protein
MSSIKDLKEAQRAAVRHQQVISELQSLVKDIERCEKTMTGLKSELDAANAKYPMPRTTRDDVAYLTALLECAKKKLAWEKLLTSLQKRTPELLQEMMGFINDPKNPPPEPVRAAMLQTLESVRNAMEKLHSGFPNQPTNPPSNPAAQA